MSAEQRRDAIVEASIRLFAEKGFRGTTTRELSKAIGVTEPVLYQHFKDKSDLYRAIIERKALEGDELIETRIKPLLDSDDDEAFFRALADLILDSFEKDPCFIRLLLFSGLEGHELNELFLERKVRGFYKLISGYMKRRMKDGAFRNVSPTAAAQAFVGALHHHGLVKILSLEAFPGEGRKQFVDEIVQIFVQGLASNKVSEKNGIKNGRRS